MTSILCPLGFLGYDPSTRSLINTQLESKKSTMILLTFDYFVYSAITITIYPVLCIVITLFSHYILYKAIINGKPIHDHSSIYHSTSRAPLITLQLELCHPLEVNIR